MNRPLQELLDFLTGEPEIVWRAPGRANLIGEHTDYNDGLVLPVALDMATYVGGRPSDGIRLTSLEEDDEIEVDPATGAGPKDGWGSYVAGVVSALTDEGIRVRGLEGAVASDVPLGAGLSSSAALELAVACAVLDDDVPPEHLAQVCQKAESEYVGTHCGVMDQMASAAAREGHALLIDCRDLSLEHVPLPEELAVLLIDSGTARELAHSGYNERRSHCEEAAKSLGAGSLRDVTLEQVEGADMDRTLRARARHVITENDRVVATIEALRGGDLATLGRTFEASHRSLAEDFEVSTPELDNLVSIASKTDGVVGARLTGAGFGGCTVNLVDARAAGDIGEAVVKRYEAETGIAARWWVSRPAAGASRVEL